jgi:putative ABC transport system substrate-binding protein
MNRRAFLATVVAFTTVPGHVSARAARKPVSIGWLTAQRESSLAPFLDAFRGGLAEYGYRENDNLKIEYRYGDDNLLRVAPLAAELIRSPVDLLVVQGAAVPLVYELRLSVPAVYVFSGDPVAAGFADSLAHPRGNMTGLTFMAAELNSKRLEILRDIIPGLQRVAIVANPEHPGSQIERTYSEETARRLGLELEFHGRGPVDRRLRCDGPASPASNLTLRRRLCHSVSSARDRLWHEASRACYFRVACVCEKWCRL